MKKFLFASLFAACAAMGLSSCMNGDYDANPDNVITGNNPLNPTNPGGGGGNPNDPGYYSWSGTDPFSAKVEGSADFQATIATANDVSGLLLVQASGGGNTLMVTFPSNAANGTVHMISSSSTNTASYTEGAATFSSAFGTGGGIYVEENDATHVKGKFFCNVKTQGGNSKNITDGYFNVTK